MGEGEGEGEGEGGFMEELGCKWRRWRRYCR